MEKFPHTHFPIRWAYLAIKRDLFEKPLLSEQSTFDILSVQRDEKLILKSFKLKTARYISCNIYRKTCKHITDNNVTTMHDIVKLLEILIARKDRSLSEKWLIVRMTTNYCHTTDNA